MLQLHISLKLSASFKASNFPRYFGNADFLWGNEATGARVLGRGALRCPSNILSCHRSRAEDLIRAHSGLCSLVQAAAAAITSRLRLGLLHDKSIRPPFEPTLKIDFRPIPLQSILYHTFKWEISIAADSRFAVRVASAICNTWRVAECYPRAQPLNQTDNVIITWNNGTNATRWRSEAVVLCCWRDWSIHSPRNSDLRVWNSADGWNLPLQLHVMCYFKPLRSLGFQLFVKLGYINHWTFKSSRVKCILQKDDNGCLNINDSHSQPNFILRCPVFSRYLFSSVTERQNAF